MWQINELNEVKSELKTEHKSKERIKRNNALEFEQQAKTLTVEHEEKNAELRDRIALLE